MREKSQAPLNDESDVFIVREKSLILFRKRGQHGVVFAQFFVTCPFRLTYFPAVARSLYAEESTALRNASRIVRHVPDEKSDRTGALVTDRFAAL